MSQCGSQEGSLFGGYAHTFVLSKFYFLSPILLAGTGINKTIQVFENSNRDLSNSNFSIFSRLTAGYNGKNWLYGIIFENDGTYNYLHQSQLNTRANSAFLFCGYRFK